MGVQFVEAVQLMLIGMGVVFSSLVVLYLVMVLIARLVAPEAPEGTGSRGGAAQAQGGMRPEGAQPAGAEQADGGREQLRAGIAPQVVAAISAAIRASVGSDARLRSIRVAKRGGGGAPPVWALAGRQEQMSAKGLYGERKAGGFGNPHEGQE